MADKEKKTCFVVMGFGKKNDYQTGRVLDLNASYHNMIKPAVEGAGLKCIRADEIVHAGVIDTPMYQQLLEADVVIADLSTANPNAFYELGVRHALRPYTTLIIAEEKLVYPFDVNHTVIRRYRHLGEDIGVGDAKAFGAEIKKALKEILKNRQNDSPVYTYLKDLRPPSLAAAIKAAGEIVEAAVEESKQKKSAEKSASRVRRASDAGDFVGREPPQRVILVGAPPARNEGRYFGREPAGIAAALRARAPRLESNKTLGELMRQADEAQGKGDFVAARKHLTAARELMRPKEPGREEDPFFVQRLALVTYKSQKPTPKKALEQARDLLSTLKPESSNDTETLGLWGAVHKRLWDETQDRAHLDEAIRGYERGFYIRSDYYNGINFAFLLNVRASESADADPAEAIADFVQAQRVRRQVVTICEQILADQTRKLSDAEKYWLPATLAEAHLGLGHTKQYRAWLKKARQVTCEPWMRKSTDEQLEKLAAMLEDSPLKRAELT
jgi:hypothetical protein